MRGLARLGLVSSLVLGACDALFLQTPVMNADLTLRFAVTGVEVPETYGAMARVDRARVRFVGPDGSAREAEVPVRGAGSQGIALLRLQPGEMVMGLALEVTLLAEGKILYEGSASVDARSGAPPSVVVAMEPLPAQVVASEETLSLRALGAKKALRATVLFATGDPIPGYVAQWRSTKPQVVSVTADGLATALQNGTAVLEASYGQYSALVAVTVAQELWEITSVDAPAQAWAGASLRLRAAGVDSLGAPMENMPILGWKTEDLRHLAVTPSGEALALSPGDGRASFTLRGQSHTVRVAVAPPPPGTLPPLVRHDHNGLNLAWLDGSIAGIVTHDHFGQTMGAGLDRDLFVYTSYRGLHRVNPSRDTVPTLVLEQTGIRDPEVSADGTWIYYGALLERGVHRIRPDGTGDQWLLREGGDASASPDGRTLAYMLGYDLMVKEEGSDPRVLVRGTFPQPGDPTWSPNGDWIAYAIRPRPVVFIRPDGSAVRQAERRGLETGVSWSPDGRWVIGSDGSLNVAVVNAETMEVIDLGWRVQKGVTWWR